jgi:hypothetical protein
MRSVDISVYQSDLVDTLSSMRVRLDHSKISARDFRSTRNAAGVVTLYAEFDDEKEAVAFSDLFTTA